MKAKPNRRARPTHLYAYAVAVCCGWCGEPQPNQDGSEMWTAEDFVDAAIRRNCVACGEPLMLNLGTRAQFDQASTAKA